MNINIFKKIRSLKTGRLKIGRMMRDKTALPGVLVMTLALLFIFGAPAWADEETDFGDSQSSAEAVTLPYSSGDAQVYDFWDTQDWFKFSLGADGWLLVEALQRDAKDGDFIVRLIAPDAAHIIDVYEGCNNVSCGAGCGPQVIYETSVNDDEVFIKAELAAGDYYVQVENIDLKPYSFDVGSYNLNISATAEAPDYGDSSASATAIASLPFTTLIDGEIGDNVHATAVTVGDAWPEDHGDGYQVDWFSFNVASSGTVVVNLAQYGGYQRVRLYAGGAVVVNAGGTATDGDTALSGRDYVYDDSDGDDLSYISVTIPGADSFYVMVEHESEDGPKDLNRSIGELTITYTSDTIYYEDCDKDGYGCDPTSPDCVSVPAANAAQAVAAGVSDCALTVSQWALSHNDCDDHNPDANPGNTSDATCDGVDDDCDGFADEDVASGDKITYYRDADGDGYGDPTYQMQACGAPFGYVENSDDCDDTDMNINPEAFDICGNGFDENCDGTDRLCYDVGDVCANLSDVPLEALAATGPPPIVMLVLDNSGSMAWDVLCPGEPDGLFHDADGYNDWTSAQTGSDEYWKAQWSEWNVVYYDPHKEYRPWYGYSDADLDNPFQRPPDDPADTTSAGGSQNLLAVFDMVDSVTNIDGGRNIIMAHYYTWSNSEGRPYLIQIYGSGGAATDYTIRYWPINPPADGELDNNNHILPETFSPPADVVTGRTDIAERQNFANWYQYYRNRQLTANAALSDVVAGTNDMIMGGTTINTNTTTGFFPATYIDDTTDDDGDGITNKQELITWLFRSGQSSGGTPLRKTYCGVGDYLASGSSKGPSPYYSEEDGGSCQSAFIIMMTDGYYNGANPGVGNADGDNSTDFDGGVFGDAYSDTLADCAMNYYENDLRPDLSDSVPTFSGDSATHQHAVTYTLSFGMKGTIDSDVYQDCPDDCPAWPYVDSKSEGEKIDDLWHAAVNGRGKYLNAETGDQLAAQLRAILAEVKERRGSGAAVSINTQTLEEGSMLYQGSYAFDASGWSGDLKAYSLDPTTGTVSDDPVWSAGANLDALTNPESDFASGGRNIWTMGAPGGVNGGMEFTAAQVTAGNFTADQMDMLGGSNLGRENLINYLRGDVSLEEDNHGPYRNRITRMGDIIHSAPVHVEDYLYVGVNDGMLHVFDGTDGLTGGDEVLAYVPGLVYHNLEDFANPEYKHKFFADQTPVLGYSTVTYGTEVDYSDVILVGGLGRGGKGYYCLGIDITNPANFSAGNVRWEYPALGVIDDNMGFSFSKPTIIETEENGMMVVFGNGYDSTNARAVLYAVWPGTGAVATMIDTGYGNTTTQCNGLSTPAFVDTDGNLKADRAYAGDLQGNLWKFDLSGDVSTWSVALDNGGTPMPLFQAMGQADPYDSASAFVPQPIVARPAVRRICVDDYDGYIVMFGTGRFNAVNDWENIEVQAVYGIWDWADEWAAAAEELELATPPTLTDKYLGVYTVPDPAGSPDVNQLSHIAGDAYYPNSGNDISLLVQSISADVDVDGVNYSQATSNEMTWFNVRRFLELSEGLDPHGKTVTDYGFDYSSDGIDNNLNGEIDEEYEGDGFDNDGDGRIDETDEQEGYNVGWRFALPTAGERVVAEVTLRMDLALIVSLRPEGDVCQASGASYFYFLDYCTGAAPSFAFLDINNDGTVAYGDGIDNDGDGLIDEPDEAVAEGYSGYDMIYDPDTNTWFLPSGVALNDIYYEPTIIGSEYSALDYIYFGAGNAITPGGSALTPGTPPGSAQEQTGLVYWRFLNIN